MVTSLLLALLTATSAGAAPHLKLEGKYEQLNGPCKDPVAIGGKHLVSSVAECEQECDKQAAAAPGTGQASCRGVDTDGKSCYLKSQCNVRDCCTVSGSQLLPACYNCSWGRRAPRPQ